MEWMRRPTAARVIGVLALAAASIAGCSGKGAMKQLADAVGATGTTGATGRGIRFAVSVEFTGDRPVRGSFIDDDHADHASCDTYVATNLPVVGWLGPQTPAGRDVKVAGETISYALMVRHDRFRGPGTYTGSVMSGLTIGQDSFIGPRSMVTINPDGSGSAEFKDFKNLRMAGRESGTMRWTCSPM